MSDRIVKCPLCGNEFPKSGLDQHLNKCQSFNEWCDEQYDVEKRWTMKMKRKDFEAETNATNNSQTNNSGAKRQRQRNLLEFTGSRKNSLSKSKPATITNTSNTKSTSNSYCSETTNQTKLLSDSNGISDLNSKSGENKSMKSSCGYNKTIPLAESMRPTTLGDFIGQEQSIGEKSMLFSLINQSKPPSLIVWGPPGCGKTTLIRIIAKTCKLRNNTKFVQLSATSSGVSEVREVIKVARTDRTMFRRDTIVFIDEIHRFNKSQQDTLLPHIEDGTIMLMGATTENPSFQVNSALLSRCRVVTMEKLTQKNIEQILRRALFKMGAKFTPVDMDGENGHKCDDDNLFSSIKTSFSIDQSTISVLAGLCDGDARAALNSLQMAAQSVSANETSSPSQVTNQCPEITVEMIKEGLQRSNILYDKTGEEHYNCISALQKSIRGSDCNGALYWLARMLEGGETPLYVARRLIRTASEDIGIADPLALSQAVSAHQACHFLGMPECDVILAQCVVYLCKAPKSVDVYRAYNQAKDTVRNHQGPLPSVPLHLRNASTRLMKDLGYGKGYKYNPDCLEPVEQDYLPSQLIGTNFFKAVT